MSQPVRYIFMPLGGQNSDDDDTLIPATDYRKAYNCNIGVSDGDTVGGAENVLGTIQVTSEIKVGQEISQLLVMPAGQNIVIGRRQDTSNETLLYYVWNSNQDHSILKLDKATRTVQFVIYAEPYFNFQFGRKWRINFSNIIGGLSYWTDNFNGNRKLNIQKALHYTYDRKNPNYYVKPFTRIVNPKNYTTDPSVKTGMMGVLLMDGKGLVDYNNFAIGHYYAIGVYTNSLDLEDPHNGIAKLVYKEVYSVSKNLLLVFDKTLFQLETGIAGDIVPYSDSQRYYHMLPHVFERIKYPAFYPPSARYVNDDSRDINLLNGHLFYWAYRYFYDDNEYSIYSPISKAVYPGGVRRLISWSGPPSGDWVEDRSAGVEIEFGHFVHDPHINNRIDVTVNTGNNEVTKIEVVFKTSVNGRWSLLKTIEKYDQDGGVLLPSGSLYTIPFYNDIEGGGVDQYEAKRPQDAVPLKSAAQTVINKNVLLDANIEEGFDNIDTRVEFNLGYANVEFPGIIHAGKQTYWNGGYYPKSDLVDIYFNHNVIPANGYKNVLWVLGISIGFEPFNTGGCGPWNHLFVYYFPHDTETLAEIVQGLILQIMKLVSVDVYPYDSTHPDRIRFHQHYLYGTNLEHETYIMEVDCYIHQQSIAFPTMKYDSSMKLGMTYFDGKGRKMTIQRDPSMQIDVPSIYEFNRQFGYFSMYVIKSVIPRYKIYHKPPLDARYWCFSWAKRIPWYVYAVATAFSTESGWTYFQVNQFLDNFKQANPNTQLGSYAFKKGDRVKFLAKFDGNDGSTGVFGGGINWAPNFTVLKKNYDFEIIGENYIEDTLNDPYQKYVDNVYILDINGHRIYKSSSQRLIVYDFNYIKEQIATYGEDPNIFGYNAQNVIVQIYRPLEELTADDKGDIFNEDGNIYPILNPGTSARRHYAPVQSQGFSSSQPATGWLDCFDAFIRLRSYPQFGFSFPVEDSGISDFYPSDIINQGNVNVFFSDAKRKRLFNKLIFSGKYFENALVNGLSRVEPLDSGYVSESSGEITGVLEVSHILKVIQEYHVTGVPIGKIQLMQSGEGGPVEASTRNVLGELIIYKEPFGCKHPESIVRLMSGFGFYDVVNKCYVMDYNNGMVNISDYKYANYWIRLSDQITAAERDVIVSAEYDIDYRRLLVYVNTFSGSTPDIGEPVPGTLPIQLDCLAFSVTRNRWTTHFHFENDSQGAEGIAMIDNSLVAFFNGIPWFFYANPVRGNFFGKKHRQSIQFVMNNKEGLEAVWMNISVLSNDKWEAPDPDDIVVSPGVRYPAGMKSRLIEARFEFIDSIASAAFLKNMLTNGSTPSVNDLVNGEGLRGVTMTMRLSNDKDGIVVLKRVIINGLI